MLTWKLFASKSLLLIKDMSVLLMLFLKSKSWINTFIDFYVLSTKEKRIKFWILYTWSFYPGEWITIFSCLLLKFWNSRIWWLSWFCKQKIFFSKWITSLHLLPLNFNVFWISLPTISTVDGFSLWYKRLPSLYSAKGFYLFNFTG